MGIKSSAGLKLATYALSEHRPKLAALLAEVSNAWALLEHNLAIQLEVLISGGHNEGIMHADPISNEVFSAVNTVEQRLNIFRRVFSVRISDATLRNELEQTVLKPLKAASRKRNILVHTLWVISPDPYYKNKIISVGPNGLHDRERMQPYGKEQILEILEEITAVIAALQKFGRKIEGVINKQTRLHVKASATLRTQGKSHATHERDRTL